MSPIKLTWENLNDNSVENMAVIYRDDHILAESTVIYQKDSKITYKVNLDCEWTTKSVYIEVDHKPILRLFTDRNGKWFNHLNQELDNLDGARDIDLSISPFTNSLPINRLPWKLNQKRELEMVYISLPILQVKKVKQIYTFLKDEKNRRVFKYQSGEFAADITVDESGYIVDYPNLFLRR